MVDYKQENLRDLVFDGQNLTGSKFDRCNLYECSFKECVLKDVVFSRCNCYKCDFTGSRFEDIINDRSNFIDEYPEVSLSDLGETQEESGDTIKEASVKE